MARKVKVSIELSREPPEPGDIMKIRTCSDETDVWSEWKEYKVIDRNSILDLQSGQVVHLPKGLASDV